MRCIVDEEGRPAAKTYRWMRGNHVQPEVHSSNLTIFPVSLETRANFSCEGTYALSIQGGTIITKQFSLKLHKQ